MNPLAMWYHRVPFGRIKANKLRWTLSVTLAILSVLVLLAVFLGTVIPQLAESVKTLADNFDGYAASLETLLDNSGLSLSGTILDPQHWRTLSENMMGTISAFLSDNARHILTATASAGRGFRSRARNRNETAA